MPSSVNIDRFRDGAIQLLPGGTAFVRDADSDLGKLIEALNVEQARVYEKLEAIRLEAVPSNATVDGLLPLWEAIFGLPGDCAPLAGTETGRQGAVKSKLRGRAGHSRAVIESIVQALGYGAVAYSTYPPFTVGTSAVGDALTNDEWGNVLRVEITVPSPDPGVEDQLRCLLEEVQRAHGFFEVVMV